MKQDEYLSSLGKNKFYRVLAWLCLIIIAALIIATFVAGITGSKYFMGFLVLTLIVPFLMYIMLWIGRVLAGSGVDKKEVDNTDNSDAKETTDY